MVTTTSRTRDDWAAAAFRVLTDAGPAAVTVEGLARELGVTKGSFYWHYASRAELLAAALAQWEARRTQAVIDRTELADTALDKLRALFRLVAQGRWDPGELNLYLLAQSSPEVAEAVHRVTHRRLDYTAALLVELGLSAQQAQRRAQAALALVLGLQMLSAGVADLRPTSAELSEVTELCLQMVLGERRGVE